MRVETQRQSHYHAIVLEIIGQTVSHYRILGKLGAGGMGEVYDAEDLKLGRRVALKFLPSGLVQNPASLERFRREARAASALNHPNICTIYEIDEADGRPFIAMELLEGRTLRDHIGGRALPVQEIVDYGIQIADALASAHQKGIIHRDIKPANIFITNQRQAKVLDFGLAKLAPDSAWLSGPAALPTIGGVDDQISQPGSFVGTVSYMSPEQALGSDLDPRTDIFSFGAVLYEMATGRLAYHGKTPAAIFDALLNKHPVPISRVNRQVPPRLEEIINIALAKDRTVRYENAGLLRDDLIQLRRVIERNDEFSRSRTGFLSTLARRPAVKWIAIAVVALLLVLAVWPTYFRTPKVDKPITVSFTQLTNQGGRQEFPGLSPDGESFIYSADGDIYLQRVGGQNPINLTRDPEARDTQPSFSPDGRLIAFRSERDGGGIFVMGATGESVKRVTDAGFNPKWSPDQKSIVYSSESVVVTPDRRTGRPSIPWTVDVSTGIKRQLADWDASQPEYSPHGYRIAYWALRSPGSQRDIWTMTAEGKNPVAVTNDAALDWNPVWSPDGRYLYFCSDRAGSMNLWRVLIEEKSGKTLAAPEPVTTPSEFVAHLSFSHDGTRLAYANVRTLQSIEKMGLDSNGDAIRGSVVVLTRGTRRFTSPRASPDGQWLTFASTGGQEAIFVSRTDGSELRQLTDDAYRNRSPVWSADSKRIAFHSDRSGVYDIWAINADGSGLQQLTDTRLQPILALWSPDGQRMICSDGVKTSYMFPLARIWKGETENRLPPVNDSGTWFSPSSWAADGKSVLGTIRTVDSPASLGIAIYTPATGTYQKLSDSGTGPLWLKDSRHLIFTNGNKISILDVRTKAIRDVSGLARIDAISPDNRWVYYSQTISESDIRMATLN